MEKRTEKQTNNIKVEDEGEEEEIDDKSNIYVVWKSRNRKKAYD